MSRLDEQLTEQFRQWEQRGRGWQVFDEPVYLEPPFRPFEGHFLPEAPPLDDGRRPTVLSSFIQRLKQALSPEPPLQNVSPEPEEEPEPQPLTRDSLIELQTSLPANLNIPKEAFEQFLLSLSLCREPIAFELLGHQQKVVAQFAAHPDDAPLLHRQLQAHFTEAVFLKTEGSLEQAWDTCEGDDLFAAEFGLEREFMFPLASRKLDPFIGIVGALGALQAGEVVVFQVLFQPVHHPWAESVLRSVTYADGRPFFVNAPELVDAAKIKVARPLYAAVVRILVRTGRHERTLQIARDLASSLSVFTHPSGNALIPLSNDRYPFEDHIDDALRRQSRRSGILLNSDELIGFVHLPSGAVRSRVLQRDTAKTKAAPGVAQASDGVLIGNNVHAGELMPVRLTPDQRVRHCHIIGASGTGKSTLLFNLIRQDIENGAGVAVLDPHGDLVERILGIVPPERIQDVVLVDPSDEEYSVGFNILHAHSNLERTLLASDLVSVFRRLSTSWGDQMDAVLKNAILAFLHSSRRGTLLDLRRFLVEPDFRADYLTSVHDPEIVYYWQRGFPLLAGNKSVGPIITRLNDFLATPTIRCMVSQADSRLDFAGIMGSGKIFLAKLPAGLVGEQDCHLLGSLLIGKFQQVAMSRQAQQATARRDFWIYADEFDHFITPSMAAILKGARKYRVGLTLAHHELQQLQRDPDVASAVLSNTLTRIVFRVGDDDAETLGEGFASFNTHDLQNLGTGEAICRIERSGFDFNLAIPQMTEPDAASAAEVRNRAITASREKYARPRAEIQAELLQHFRTKERDPASEPSPAKRERKKSDAAEAKSSEAPPAPVPLVVLPPPASEEDTTATVEPSKPEVAASEPAEVWKEPVLETKEALTAPPEPVSARELGRGGAQHKSIQERIQQEAHKLGFFAAIESQLAASSNQAADLVLRRGETAIAVEITVTTTTDHEFGNIKKCLAAGFGQVAVVSPKPASLQAIALAVLAGLGKDAAAKVCYFSPDELIAELKKLAAQADAQPPPSVPRERKIRGYTVRRHGPQLSAEERQLKEPVAIEVMRQAMKER